MAQAPSTPIKVPLCIPDMNDEEARAVAEVLKSGWLAHGPANAEFEKLFSEYHGIPHCVSVNSCASALHLAIQAAGIRGEVILPSFTWVASANAILTGGALTGSTLGHKQVVFADVEYDTCNLNAALVESMVTSRTEAIMPVHFAGHAADMEAFAKIAAKHKLHLIEDSAEAIGATQNGKKTGSWGTGCFSFYPTKNLTTGEGGMFTTRDADLAAKAKAIAGHGVSSSTFAREKAERPWLRAATNLGFNFRMSSINAAVGAIQMKKLDAMNAARRKHAAQYSKLLNQEFFELPVERPGFVHVYQMYTIKLKGVDRTKFLAKLRAEGIGASVHFDPAVHQQPYWAELGFGKQNLPITDKITATIATLPIYPTMKESDVSMVAEACNKYAPLCRA